MHMICRYCAANIPDDSKICPQCHARLEADNSGVSLDKTTHGSSPAPSESMANRQGEDANSGGMPQQGGNMNGQSWASNGQGMNGQGGAPNDQGINQQGGAPYGYSQPPAGALPNSTTYMVLSILLTVCCCLPLGIASIIYANKISNALSAGRYEEAIRSASTARILLIIGFVLGLIVLIGYLFIYFLGFMATYY